ncbi:MAG: hypothetical protein ABI851_00435 [Saprospiraceae bacterium]
MKIFQTLFHKFFEETPFLKDNFSLLPFVSEKNILLILCLNKLSNRLIIIKVWKSNLKELYLITLTIRNLELNIEYSAMEYIEVPDELRVGYYLNKFPGENKEDNFLIILKIYTKLFESRFKEIILGKLWEKLYRL